ncbi:unnamed protein product [Eruca vesicaria subsp. sativa]|uniref:Uncharacterized protein n=1 Tax=Eruca vesicaria subsp. sativa TaxID=29727 RepID=A0ABC8LSX2_ERUVS|nr:unnamed protein product [Eruca vesicaria subsp. sativa]
MKKTENTSLIWGREGTSLKWPRQLISFSSSSSPPSHSSLPPLILRHRRRKITSKPAESLKR